MTIKAEEMRRLTTYWIELSKLRDNVLEHAKTFTKTEQYNSWSQLHVDEFSFLFNAKLDDFKELFKDLGYEVHIDKYDEVKNGYLGEIRLYW